ncbi:MAG: DUF3131 domain-containing protein [Pseudomonadota bacterium]
MIPIYLQKFGNFLLPFIFVLGLVLAAMLSILFDRAANYVYFSNDDIYKHASSSLPLASSRDLTSLEISAANIAWSYIRRNTREQTGLVDSVEDFPSSTLWDQGSYLLALVAAFQLELISQDEFERRIGAVLTAFQSMELFDNKLPNKVYNTVTLEMTDYGNSPVEGGIGWSALDIARFLSALRIVQIHSSTHGARVSELLAGWSLRGLSQAGEIIGTNTLSGTTQYVQEGRIGYEQYAARAGLLWGLDFSKAVTGSYIHQWREIDGIEVPIDRRQATAFGAITPTLSEPYFLMAMEMGLEGEHLSLASQVYKVQERRYKNTGIRTMVSEDHVSVYPNFLYSSVYSNGEDWAVVSEQGDKYPSLRTLSIKSVFAWNAIFSTEYTKSLFQHISTFGNLERGWPAGIYEESQEINEVYTLNTNSIILQSLYYRKFGVMMSLP